METRELLEVLRVVGTRCGQAGMCWSRAEPGPPLCSGYNEDDTRDYYIQLDLISKVQVVQKKHGPLNIWPHLEKKNLCS